VWKAPAHTSVLVSVLWRPPPDTRRRLTWLPLAAGLAVAESLDPLIPLPVHVKWPNDVVLQAGDGEPNVPGWGRRRKVAGIMVEMAPAPGTGVVVGIGVNVAQRAEELPVPWAASLATAGAPHPDRSVVLKRVLRRLATVYDAWEQDLPSLKAEIQARCISVGEDLLIGDAVEEPNRGRGLRLDPTGALVIGLPNGSEYTVTAGDMRSPTAEPLRSYWEPTTLPKGE
jgi:BirA family biotin operon repressor/biotin-[acetyl-CoA-carboxylase] ligase